MIVLVPASQLTVGDVFSTDGAIVKVVVLLPKTERVFVQAICHGDTLKTEALPQDQLCPIWKRGGAAST